jgi:hypothetical protein
MPHDGVSRRGFFATSQGLLLLGLSGDQVAAAPPVSTIVTDSYPSYDLELVREVVTVSHFNAARVRELIEPRPALARATIDWGFGDAESCIDAASHMGRREIAELLIAHGARPTMFTAAMLGMLDVVKALVVARPGVQRARGPHGLSLMAHARAGGPEAEPVARYLAALGDADLPLGAAPLASADRDALVGRYVFGTGPRDYFDVDVERDQLGIGRPGGPARRALTHAGDWVFFPAGAPSVRVAFARVDGTVRRLTIADPDVILTATRAAD